ncbi:MAG: NADP-dependent oxidoreductase [Caulobacteraceae bacterium]|nr:NADP-dependent oxidoreductase [Caulobacter sp.]
MPVTSREIRLKSRPVGEPSAADFELATADVRDPAAGEVQVENLWMSVDPYMRGRMYDRPSYVPPFELDKALQGGAVGRVTASGDDRFKPGDLVQSMMGWRERFTAKADHLQPLETHGAPEQAFLGVLGMPGMTGWGGLLKIAQMKAGDVVFVSGAAGAVGQVVCQVAKLKGAAQVIGSAGGADKGAWLREIGCDAVIDYKAEPDLKAALKREAPKGIDVYFDNVGGDHLEAAMDAARPFARFAECGMISQYNAETPEPGPSNMSLIVGKRLRLQGFIVSDLAEHQAEFAREMGGWVRDGKLRWKETVDEGIESAPGAFIKLFRGGNTGKMLVKLAG